MDDFRKGNFYAEGPNQRHTSLNYHPIVSLPKVSKLLMDIIEKKTYIQKWITGLQTKKHRKRSQITKDYKNLFNISPIMWIINEGKKLFPLKDKDIYPASKICHGLWFCNESYIDRSKHNMRTRWRVHNDPIHDSKSADHLNKINQLR